ncbi:hypothetical protein BDF22DRAFT_694082 [Syncephalis plumigaleata]|nr:hypothetical protein BDF22DRAFT_694082 [Syncephalis plumigaleata]
MPIYYDNSELGDDWEKNATTLFGIPLHPLGEMEVIYYAQHNLDMGLPIRAMVGMERQIFVVVVVTCLFSINMVTALRMLIQKPRAMSSWICVFPHALGASWGYMCYVALIFGHLNCRMIVWYMAVGASLSAASNGGIILQKAYLVLLRRRWVLIVGIVLTLPQLAIFVITWFFCPAVLHPDYGCTFYYPAYLPWIWMGVEAPSYIMFSSIFSYVAYKQYKAFKTDVWKRLARDGILVMCLAILCKLVCGTIVVANLLGPASQMFVLVDWFILSTILLLHCYDMRNSTHIPDAPKSECTAHIATNHDINSECDLVVAFPIV